MKLKIEIRWKEIKMKMIQQTLKKSVAVEETLCPEIFCRSFFYGLAAMAMGHQTKNLAESQRAAGPAFGQ